MAASATDIAEYLLMEGDPVPFTVENPAGCAPAVLVCEHAGRAIPVRLGDLALPPSEMERHIAYDLGAEALAQQLSVALDAPLVVQRYSRLVIDCNRPLSAPDAIPETSDGTCVPGNRGLTAEQRRQRYDEIHAPFHEAVARIIDQRLVAGRKTALVAIHSFTPRLAGGTPRACHLGVLYNRDARLADAIIAAALQLTGSARVVRNAPYAVDDASDYTIPVHGEGRGIPHALLEVRNDLIQDDEGLRDWTDRLDRLLTEALAKVKAPA